MPQHGAQRRDAPDHQNHRRLHSGDGACRAAQGAPRCSVTGYSAERPHPGPLDGGRGGHCRGPPAGTLQLRPEDSSFQGLRAVCQGDPGRPVPAHSAPELRLAHRSLHWRDHPAVHLRRGRNPQFCVQPAGGGGAHRISHHSISLHYVLYERQAVPGGSAVHSHCGPVLRGVLQEDLLSVPGGR